MGHVISVGSVIFDEGSKVNPTQRATVAGNSKRPAGLDEYRDR